MTDPEPAGTCQVSLLVPHPGRTAVLVVDGDPPSGAATPPTPTPPTLPTLRVTGAEPQLPDLLAAVDVVDTARTAALRLVMTSPVDARDVEDAEDAMLLEFEAGATEPPAGWTWQDLDADAIARLEPSTSRESVASWARERAEGWSPLRPPWSIPGWFARASTWMVDRMAADGLHAVGKPRLHQLWGVSVVLRCSSTDGDAFLKCSADIFRHEAVATRALAEAMPDLVPEVIAVDGDRGWLLMRDLGAAELGAQDQSRWHHGIVAQAGIQQSWLGRTDELVALGLPVRSLTDLAAQVEAMSEDTVLLARLPADVRERWLASAPALAGSCRRLDELGPGPTLVHGDLHPWNVAHGETTTRVFDWTDAAVSHPFVDLATYVFRTQDESVRRHLLDAYVGAWAPLASAESESLREAVGLGLVVGALYQVQSYRAILPTLMADGADDGLAQSDLSWIARSLARHERGLESPS